MTPFQVLDENALAVVKLKPMQNLKGLKQSKPPGEMESQLYELRGDLRHVEKQQTVMKTQQANLHDKYVHLQHDVDELKSVNRTGSQVQTPLKNRTAVDCGPSPPVPAAQARSVLPTGSTVSTVDGEQLKVEHEKLRDQVSELQAFLTPELQLALTALVSSSKSDNSTTVFELKKRLELHMTRNARLEEELAEYKAQLAIHKGLREELESKKEELNKVKKSLATAETRLDELDVADVSGLLTLDDVATPLPRIASMRNKRISSLRSGAPQLPPVVPPSPFKM